MNSAFILRKTCAVIFAITIAFTISVREVHYLFTQHDAEEQCENHLHNADNHSDCAVCKFDISIFTDELSLPPFVAQTFFHVHHVAFQSVISDRQFLSNSLRGPPSRA
jgi:hypothetical protein